MPHSDNGNNRVEKNSILDRRDALLISKMEAEEAAVRDRLKDSDLDQLSFADRMKTNRFWVIRMLYYVFYSVWMIVMGIGMFIAWLISLLFI